MRIRFFNTFEPVNSFYRDLLPFLADRGIEVEVIVSRAEYRPGRRSLDDSLNHPQIQIKYIPVGQLRLGGKLQKAWIGLTYMVGAAIQTLFGRATDLNFFLTQPPLFSIWGYILKIIRRQRYCIQVMDIYPDVAMQSGMLVKTALLAQMFTMLSRFALRHANQVIVIGHCMQERLHQAGVSLERMQVIPNWVNEIEVYPVPSDQNQLQSALGLEDTFVVLYSGNIGVPHFFDDLLEVARQLQNTPRLRFVFIGNGARLQEIEQAKETYNLSNILLLPFQPIERLAHSLNLGDVHFVSLRSGFEGLVVPSKTYGVLASGRPVIYQGSSSGEIAQMLVEEDVGTVVPCNDVEGLKQTILRYVNQPNLCRRQGSKALALSEGSYSRHQALERYARVLKIANLNLGKIG